MNVDQYAQNAAIMLCDAIENQCSEHIIGMQTQELVRRLGGKADVSELSPGAAAVYLLSLVLSRPQGA